VFLITTFQGAIKPPAMRVAVDFKKTFVKKHDWLVKTAPVLLD
jgi:hypothetical protein